MSGITVHEKLIPLGHPNRPGGKIDKLVAFVYHYTANDNLSATDTANANYFARKYLTKVENGKKVYYEADGIRKFGYGSTNKIVDLDSITICIPTGEPSWHAGDRQFPYDNGYKGQTKIAAEVFGYRQNYQCISWEMCNNNNWPKVVENTINDAIDECIKQGVKAWDILHLRHYDLSGKKCPLAFVKDEAAWADFKMRILKGYAERTGEKMPQEIAATVFKKGVNDPGVQTLMKDLYTLGYNPNGTLFGNHEEATVMHFQKFNGLEADGIAGPATQKKIADLLPKKPVTEVKPKALFQATVKTDLNFRSSGVVLANNKIGTIPKGNMVDVYSLKDGWAQVSYNGKYGYVMYSYLAPTESIFPDTYKRYRAFDSDVHVFEVTPDMFLDLEKGVENVMEKPSAIKSTSKHPFLGIEVARMNAQFFGGGSDGLGSIADEGIIKQGPNPLFIDAIYYKNGTFDVKKIKNQAELVEINNKAYWITGSSWQLIYDKKKALYNYEGIPHYRERHPRSLLLYFGPNHFALMAIDGRGRASQIETGKSNAGVTALQCQDIVMDYVSMYSKTKPVISVNYDGGDSTALLVRMKDGSMKVVNQIPSAGERAVGTIFIVSNKK